jgi:hypothetical protein
MLVIESEDNPVLVSVIFCAALVLCSGWFAKVRLEGESVTAGAPVTPVPVSVAGTGEIEDRKATFTVALYVLVLAGVKVTLIVQLDPAETVPQLFVSEKSLGLAP